MRNDCTQSAQVDRNKLINKQFSDVIDEFCNGCFFPGEARDGRESVPHSSYLRLESVSGESLVLSMTDIDVCCNFIGQFGPMGDVKTHLLLSDKILIECNKLRYDRIIFFTMAFCLIFFRH